MTGLQQALLNYQHRRIVETLYVKARKEGQIVFDGYYPTTATIETNYSRITIMWDEGQLPLEYREPSVYGVEFNYYSSNDKLRISGDFNGDTFEIEVDLPSI